MTDNGGFGTVYYFRERDGVAVVTSAIVTERTTTAKEIRYICKDSDGRNICLDSSRACFDRKELLLGLKEALTRNINSEPGNKESMYYNAHFNGNEDTEFDSYSDLIGKKVGILNIRGASSSSFNVIMNFYSIDTAVVDSVTEKKEGIFFNVKQEGKTYPYSEITRSADFVLFKESEIDNVISHIKKPLVEIIKQIDDYLELLDNPCVSTNRIAINTIKLRTTITEDILEEGFREVKK